MEVRRKHGARWCYRGAGGLRGDPVTSRGEPRPLVLGIGALSHGEILSVSSDTLLGRVPPGWQMESRGSPGKSEGVRHEG